MEFDEKATVEKLKRAMSHHASPYSTLIVAMGDHWEPGCRESAEAMRDYARSLQMDVHMRIEPDRCYNWGDALGSMRNMGYRWALLSGYEFLLYLDNDVIAPKHTLAQLLSHQMPIISPKIVYADGHHYDLEIPKLEDDRGLAMAGSVMLSCMLVRAAVFFPWATADFWGNAIGDDEEYHFVKLAMLGIRPFVDTGVTVVCQKPPHFPLSKRRQELKAQTVSGLVVVK